MLEQNIVFALYMNSISLEWNGIAPDFSIVIQIGLKTGFNATPLLGIASLPNFALGTTAQLNISQLSPKYNLDESRMKFPLHLYYDGTIVREMDPRKSIRKSYAQ